jgi:hypothetical protein
VLLPLCALALVASAAPQGPAVTTTRYHVRLRREDIRERRADQIHRGPGQLSAVEKILHRRFPMGGFIARQNKTAAGD